MTTLNQTQLLERIVATLNAATITNGSKVLSTSPAYLAVGATTYTGGLTLKNTDASIAIWYKIGGAASIAGTDCDVLTAGERIPVPWGDVSTISVVAASGTPTIAWSGATLA